MMNDRIPEQVKVKISNEAADDLINMKELTGVPHEGDALADALAVYKLFVEHSQNGGKILLKKRFYRTKQIVIPTNEK